MLYGTFTGAGVGEVVRDMVQNAMSCIRALRHSFTVTHKQGYNGSDDLFTTADTQSQAVYVEAIRKHFPGFGIIAEELGVRIPCTLPGMNAYFTIDPLDGTKAFKRGHSFGVATMIALVVDGVVVCSYIGDVWTGEIFGYEPESTSVQRIYPDGSVYDMTQVDRGTSLNRQYLLLRAAPSNYHPAVARMASSPGFRSFEITSGSIGLSMSRLWKGEVGAHVTRQSAHATPWDSTPVIGISQRLGMVWLYADSHGRLRKYNPPLPLEVSPSPGDLVTVHESHVDELQHIAR